MNKTTVEPWVSVKEIATHLGQTENWVRRYAPAMPHSRIGRQYRFKLTEVEAWMDEMRGGYDVY